MTHIQRSALVPFSCRQMYELINDIESYPVFMDGCEGAEIIEQTAETITARLDLSRKGFNLSFTTQNTLKQDEKVIMRLVDGPFSRFTGEWRLIALEGSACKVELELDFSLKNKMLSLAAGKVLNAIGDKLVDSVVAHAHQQYQVS